MPERLCRPDPFSWANLAKFEPKGLCLSLIHGGRGLYMAELTREQLVAAVVSGRGPAYLRGVDLSKLDLSGAGWLAEADLRHANLSHANLTRADLREARLARANLQASNLSAANMEKADLCEARLNEASLKLATLRAGNLEGATLTGANLSKADLREVNLESANLERANLEGADLRRAKLNGANLKGANLRGANLQGASLLGALTDEVAGSSSVPMPSRGFAGVLGSIQLVDLIQMLSLQRANTLVRVRAPGLQGVIHIRGGQVCHAEAGLFTGEQAFYEILSWRRGKFETLALAGTDITTIDKPLQHLIIESMRRQDEKTSLRKSNANLVEEIREFLPLPVFASKELMTLINKEGKMIGPNEELIVEDIFDSEDEADLFCSIVAADEVFIAPLHYVRPKEDHPFAGKMLELHGGAMGKVI